MGPKSYAAINDDDLEIKRSSKGIPHSIELNVELYRKVLLDDEKHSVKFDQLRLNRKKEMHRSTLNKVGLTDFCIKQYISDDKITCTPLKKDNKYL